MTLQTNSESDRTPRRAIPQHLLSAPPSHPFLSAASKRGYTQWYMITGGVVLFIISAVISYFVAGMLFPSAKTDTAVQPIETVQTSPATTNSVPDQAAKILTDSLTAETTATDTDDSSEVTDASASVTTAGGGVDENNF